MLYVPVNPMFPGDSLATHQGRDGKICPLQLCPFLGLGSHEEIYFYL